MLFRHGSNSEPVITVESNNSDSEASSSFEYPVRLTIKLSFLLFLLNIFFCRN